MLLGGTQNGASVLEIVGWFPMKVDRHGFAAQQSHS